MVELKLASDDDTYLDEAVEENKSYTVRTVFIIVRENKGSKVELIPIKAVLFLKGLLCDTNQHIKSSRPSDLCYAFHRGQNVVIFRFLAITLSLIHISEPTRPY